MLSSIRYLIVGLLLLASPSTSPSGRTQHLLNTARFSRGRLDGGTLAPMTTAPVRSGVSSRSRGPSTFETGLHADADFGTIDVGLAVDGGTFGVVIDAPVVGHLRVAFDVAADGATRLSSMARRSTEGVELPVIIVDETKTHALEAELVTLRRSFEAVQAEVSEAKATGDEATARITQLTQALEAARADGEAGLARALADAADATARVKAEAETEAARLLDEVKDDAERLETETTRLREEAQAQAARLETELTAAKAAAQSEKDARVTLLGEREKARAELDRVRGELDAGSATLMREVSEARAARDAAEAERTRISGELTELSTALENRRQELADAKTDLERVSTELGELQASRESDLGQIADVTAEKARLEQALADARTTLQAELDARSAEMNEARATRERLERELDDARALLDGDRTSAEQSRLAMRDALVEKEHALAATAAERHALVQAHADELLAAQAREDTLRSALAGAEADQSQLSHDLAELRSAMQALEAQSATTQASLEAREEAFAHAVEQKESAAQERDVLRDQLQSTQAALEAQQQTAAEAQRLMAEHEAVGATLAAERDEARNVARGLHQRIAGSGVEALKAELTTLRASLETARQNMTGVVSERDRALLQIDSLGRQIDQERSARAKAIIERDQYRDRFKVLTTSTGGSGEMPRPTITSEDTKAYAARPTGETPAIESPTDVTVLPSDFNKKKGP